ncbi:transient receptor potential cation channel subfamily A member 1 [Dromiciops gliroides]|uniref:transient receptor potential cation channel subfamily A member 1 n=1 Tax=Dromiciops gliroides TaxID=33562 RepID=UPI001CC7BAD6|nr:transient receptor potential cation channel subfamily A member 1 [Dromiciops gliroides]
MKLSVKKVLKATGENKELQGVAYEGVENETDASEEDVFKVILKGNVKRLQSFIMKNRDGLHKYDELNATPLHHAAAQDQVELLEMIINDSSFEGLNVLDVSGNTPLHWATEKNQIENVKFLLSKGANPNICNNNLMSPLHLAIQGLYNEIVKVLIEHSGTDVNLIGENGNTPLMLACSKDNNEALKLLVDNGAKICKSNKFGCFPVHIAAFSGSKKCMEMLLKYGEEQGYSRQNHINFLNNKNASPLHFAVQSGDLEMIKICLANGAQVNLEENGKCTALHFAATQGATEIVKLMISSYSGSDDIINTLDGNDETLLHRVALFDHHELAEYLISMGANLNSIDCEGRSPLLLATSSASWNVMNLLLSKGANVEIKDYFGRNFLHLTVLQPYGLKNLKQEFLQMQHIKNLVMDEDIDGCTPLHYACSQGVPLSVNNLLCLNVSICTKSKDNKSPLHFAANFGRINTCQRLVRDMTDTRLLNEGDQSGMTPLHLAAKNGHDKVVKFLLKKGALFLSDHNGWTALHHASMGGYTQTMKIILDTNVKCTDYIDEEGNTALHYAAREGHAKAVALLLDYDAEILMNKQSASFLHDAIHNRRKEVVIITIRSKRWDECLSVFNPVSVTNKCAVLEMVEYLPECMKSLLDICIVESTEERSCLNFHVEYNFKYLQSPLELRQKEDSNNILYGPLSTLNAMVQHNRRDLLDHPICREFLLMKWMAYGFRAHVMNLGLYCFGLIPMTILISNVKPGVAFNSTGIINGTNNGSEPLNNENSYVINICMILVFLSSIFGFCKELIQIFQQRMNYFLDYSNLLEWVIYTTSIIFVAPLFINIPTTLQWKCGAISVFLFWMNFLLYLQRFENCGIYVVMLLEITKTLLKTTFVFFFLILAFGLGFHVLLGFQNAFKTPVLSVLQTFSMMLGDLNYHEAFLMPLLEDNLPYPFLSISFLIIFTLYVPIVLMNLLIGLAVGDIAEVQKNASLKRIAMQVKLHTSLEKKLPYWFLSKVDQESITVYPNKRKKYGFMSLFHYCFCSRYTKPETQHTDKTLEVEVLKQKYRLKDLSMLLEKQHELVKLIIQKMEIISEAEDEDSSFSFQQRFRNKQLEKNSKWHSVLKAVKAKKPCV